VQFVLGILVLVALVFAVVRLTGARRLGGGRRRFKCHDCRHLRRSFDDGVMCGYGTREVYKTPANIRMCGDWAPVEASRRR